MTNYPSTASEQSADQSPMIWLHICSLAKIPPNKAIGLTIGGQRLVIARCGDDNAQILQGHCTHMGVPLDNARVKNCAVTCWLHQSTFSVADGAVIQWTTVVSLTGPALETVKAKNALRTFETRVTDGEVLLHWPGQPDESIDVQIRF